MQDRLDIGRSALGPRRRRGGAPAWLIAAALASGGCGAPPGDGVAVSGRVSFDGEPLGEGTVTMVPLDAPDSAVVATAIKGGSFRTSREDGPRPGRHRVEIRGFAPITGAESAKARARAAASVNTVLFGKDASAFGGGEEAAIPRVNMVPERYNVRSELTAEIPAAPGHELEFTLTK